MELTVVRTFAEIAGRPRRLGGYRAPAPGVLPPPTPFSPLTDPLPAAGGVPESWIPTALDQGQIGDCTGQTVREVMQGAAARAGVFSARFSALYAYYYARAGEGTAPTDDAGAAVSSAFAVASERGLPRIELWPDERRFDEKPDDGADRDAALHKSLLHFGLPDLDTMRACLAVGFGFGFGFDVPSQMTSAACARSGLVEFPKGDDGWTGGSHAVTAWRWDDEIRVGDSVGAFDCLNHWGSAWGRSGRFWLPYDFFKSGHAEDACTIRRISTWGAQ